jgi:hypothetical protein
MWQTFVVEPYCKHYLNQINYTPDGDKPEESRREEKELDGKEARGKGICGNTFLAKTASWMDRGAGFGAQSLYREAIAA